MERSFFGRAFDDFCVGDELRHWPGKTITQADNHLFCLLTMNHHPVHIDSSYAASTGFGKPVVVGTLVLSLAVGMSVRDLSGQAIANLGYDDVRHLGPTFEGETLYATSTIQQKRLSRSDPSRGIVTARTLGQTQDERNVISFVRTFLVPV